MRKCPECDSEVRDDVPFCGQCGAQVSPPSGEIVSATPADDAVVPSLSEKPPAVTRVADASAQSLLGVSLGGSSPDADTNAKPQGRKRTTGGHQPAIKQLDPGTVLNSRYEIVRRIGGGGMGAVYLAKDRNLGDAPRAVKEMVETHLDETQHEKAIGDFKRESLLLTSLEHPSIPTIYDYFYDSTLNRFYLVMKYISGGDLASRLRSSTGGKLDEKTVADWGMQVADVLEYLHTRPKPIIYRDLKPANLMIDGNSGRVMLIDFGIARWVAKQEKGVTAVGTMGYAPPELFSGRVEPRSDVYSLGATMFHLLTGSDPQDNPLLIFDFSKNPRPRQIAPSISSEMERILMRAVEYKPEDRFRSAGEVRDGLAEHLEKLIAGRVSYGQPAPELGGETVQVQTVFCGFCGGRIAIDDVFCAHCGARQPLGAVAASASLKASRLTAKLVVAGTAELDSSFVLQKDSNLVGRADPHSNIFPEIDLSKFDRETKVSRRHARIWCEGDTFLVEDLGSVNGTVINDSVRLAPRQPRVLDSGDRIRLGETTLHFLVG
jgi:tRNA A-37 threonylcarbamoyl transferase component Bud32